jgi:isoleucyl-tRNA synthetase
MRVSPAMMTQLAEAYRKIRNTFRFALSNLFDFDPVRNQVADEDLWEIDAWMVRRTGALVRQCLEWYANFEFHRVYHALHEFCVVDLSAFYLDVLKDRLYTFAPNNRGRRSAQTAVYRIANALVRTIAPILVFTSEEIWKHLPHEDSAPASVHISLFPEAAELEQVFDAARSKNWERLVKVRDDVLKALESARNAKTISAALEAKVIFRASGEDMAFLRTYAPLLPAMFIVSQIEFLASDSPTASNNAGGAYSIEVKRADGVKCERCWNYSTHVGENSDYPTVCERCVAALAEIERDSGTLAGSAVS